MGRTQSGLLQQRFTQLCVDWLRNRAGWENFDLRNEASVKLAQELLPDEDGYRAVTHIPAAMVESLTFLVGEHPPATDGAALPHGA